MKQDYTGKQLKQLQDLRNKMFPPKLEAGCGITTNAYGGVAQIGEIVGVGKGEYLVDIDLDSIEPWAVKKDEIIKILGKELTILDILRMLPKQGLKTRITAHYIYITYKEIEIALYMKEPLIKNQPEATIKQLNKLLCN